MAIIKAVAYGDWRNEDNVRVKMNRNYITGGASFPASTTINVPDSAIFFPDEGGYRNEQYVFDSYNAYDITTLTHYKPIEGSPETLTEKLTTIELSEYMYPYFVYLIPTPQSALEQTSLYDYYNIPKPTGE